MNSARRRMDKINRQHYVAEKLLFWSFYLAGFYYVGKMFWRVLIAA